MEKSEKSEIRKWVKEQRIALEAATEVKWNEAVCRQLLNLNEIRHAFCVFCYASFPGEVSTWRFMEALLRQGKYIAVPKVTGKELEFYSISGKRIWRKGSWESWSPKPAA